MMKICFVDKKEESIKPGFPTAAVLVTPGHYAVKSGGSVFVEAEEGPAAVPLAHASVNPVGANVAPLYRGLAAPVLFVIGRIPTWVFRSS